MAEGCVLQVHAFPRLTFHLWQWARATCNANRSWSRSNRSRWRATFSGSAQRRCCAADWRARASGVRLAERSGPRASEANFPMRLISAAASGRARHRRIASAPVCPQTAALLSPARRRDSAGILVRAKSDWLHRRWANLTFPGTYSPPSRPRTGQRSAVGENGPLREKDSRPLGHRQRGIEHSIRVMMPASAAATSATSPARLRAPVNRAARDPGGAERQIAAVIRGDCTVTVPQVSA